MKLQQHELHSEELGFLKEARFNSGDYLPSSQHYAWFLKKGIVKTYTWNQEGNCIILGYWGSGELVGPPLSVIAPYNMQCRTAVEAERVPTQHWLHWGQCLHHHCKQNEELLLINRCEPLVERLGLFLSWLASKVGKPVDEGWQIDFKLTHQELAEAIGSSRVTITRLLSELEQQGAIERFNNRGIVVKVLKSVMD
jgi:CRP-like cAMP-binding protein